MNHKVDLSKLKPIKPEHLPPKVQANVAHSDEMVRRALQNLTGVKIPEGMLPEEYKNLSIDQIQEQHNMLKFLTCDPDMANMLLRAEMYSHGNEPVLITGESGTGKELVARIVGGAETPDRPFIALNCAGFNDELLSNELFGHVAGAYTGATMKGKTGMVAAALEGTLFLDEIGDMPLTQQAHLLRLIEYGEYYQVGSTDKQKAHCRFVFATNVDLHEAVKRGTFRRDLFWRISALRLHITPLRDRPEDVKLIARELATVHNDPNSKSYVHPFTDEELETIPHSEGNVREILNYIIARRYEHRLATRRQS